LKLYLVPLIFVTTGSMVWAIGVLYALDLGASIFQVNLITTIHNTMGILLLVPFGILSDRLGRRPMLIYPRIVVFLGILIRTFAIDPSHLIIAAFIGGFAGGGFFPILLSMITDLTDQEERQEAISILYLFSGFGMLLGPLMGSFLLTMPRITLRTLYQIHAVTQGGIIVYLATQIKETKTPTPETESRPYMIHIKELVRSPSFKSLLFTGFLFSLYNAVVNTYIPVYARLELNLSDAEVSSLSVYRNLAVVLIRFSCATILTRIPTIILLVSTLCIGGISGLAAPFADSYLYLILIRSMNGICHGATMSLGSTLVAGETKTENRGVANSLYNVAQSTGGIMNVLTSPIAENQGLIPVFILGGISALLAALPVPLTRRRHQKGEIFKEGI